MSTGTDSAQTDNQAATQGANGPQSAGGGEGRRILQYYQENKWGSVNDLVEESQVRSTEDIECTKYVEKILTYEDEEMVREVPVTQGKRIDLKATFADVWAPDRDSFVPKEFEEGHADFARPETERVNTCSDCGGNGRHRCSGCSGSGHNSCSRCSGSGVTGDSRCGSCGGSGTKVCGTCDGTGTTACETCEQKGETWKVDFVRREYTPEEHVTADAPGVPESYVTDAAGKYVETVEQDLGQNEIWHEVDEYDVDVTRVNYVYDGKDYELYEVDEEDINAPDYPKNQARKMLPYVVAGVVGVGILAFVLMDMGVI